MLTSLLCRGARCGQVAPLFPSAAAARQRSAGTALARAQKTAQARHVHHGSVWHRGNGNTNVGGPLTRRISHKNVISDGVEVTLRLHRDHLVVQHSRWPVEDMLLSLPWLRDHCRCPLCYDRSTFQRKTDIRQLEFNVHPKLFEVDAKGENIRIVWHDGHRSEYSLRWLWQNSAASYPYRQLQQNRLWNRRLWDARAAARHGLTTVDQAAMLDTDDGLRHLLAAFLSDGVAAVTGVEATLAATQRVIERVGVVQHTMFGGMWEFTSDGAQADTAYTQQGLGPHTDGTYYSEPPGVQVFHCLGHSGEGGDTTLVDGFFGLQRLYLSNPAAYLLLSSEPCAAEYRDPGRDLHLLCSDTVISHRAGGQAAPERLLKLRFNPYDRAPARAQSPPQVEPFYRAYQLLADVLMSERLVRKIKLSPGMVLFIDNWRVLHGRTSFSGSRRMCGGYIARSDIMSRARVAGLLV